MDNPDGTTPLRLERVTVDYGERRAVDGLSLTVRPGEIYGLLGSNGAGKSSTIKSIVGLVRPSSGTVVVFGDDAVSDGIRAKEHLGYVPETALLYEALTPREFLEFVAGVRRLDRAVASERLRTYATAFRLDSELEEPIATLSNGTRQKVLVLAALLHAPRLLVLDEPLNSLDPRSVRIVKELLLRFVRTGGRGVLLSTHTMEIAEELCGRVGILDQGVLRAEGTLAELRTRAARGDASLEEVFLRLTRQDEGLTEAVASLDGP
ncbi:MAG TPA: ABC transporter ATP-binding protein [Thermoplasmata archaeon]|nr:ABC transporter ATP-binding protein [Thermoplasmata archaeon]